MSISSFPEMLNRRGNRYIVLLCIAIGVMAPNDLMASTSRSQLDQDLSTLQADTTSLTKILPGLKFSESLLAVGISSGVAGSSVTLPINFIAGPTPIVAVQGTLVIGSSIALTNVVAGPSATAASKSVSTSGNSFVVFGLNQTTIGQGELLSIELKLPSSLSNNLYPVTLINPVASDAAGNEVLINTISGTVEVP